jgi:uncharacterized protein
VTLLHWFFGPSTMPKTPLTLASALIQFISSPALSFGYICLVVLICQNAAKRIALHRFGAIGRTALSNYLLQSVIGTLIFYSYGLGLFGLVGPAVLIILTVVIYALQAILSPWWIARYRFGPVEWLWRRMTYGKTMERPHESVLAEPAITS